MDRRGLTCNYDLPCGPLALRVNVSDDNQSALTFFAARRDELTDVQELVGPGEQAYSTPIGTLGVVKDDMTLTVDPSGLPDVFGDNDQRRSAFAFTVGAVVRGCWIDHG